MRQLSLTERLIQRIHLKEEVAAAQGNTHHLSHRFFRDFLQLPRRELRQLTLRLMLAAVDQLRRSLQHRPPTKPNPQKNRLPGPWFEGRLTSKLQWLLFEYGMGVLVISPAGKLVHCRRTGYLPTAPVYRAVHEKVERSSQLISRLLVELADCCGRREFVSRLARSAGQRRRAKRMTVGQKQLELDFARGEPQQPDEVRLASLLKTELKVKFGVRIGDRVTVRLEGTERTGDLVIVLEREGNAPSLGFRGSPLTFRLDQCSGITRAPAR